MSDLYSLTKKLCALDGVGNYEDEVRTFIRQQVTDLADEVRTDSMGNLIVFKKGKKPTGQKLLLAAHMDEVGLIITRITDEGYLKFSTIGSIDRRVLIGKPVRVGWNKVPGVIGLKAYHLVSAEEEKRVPKLHEYYIDIGAASAEEAKQMVHPGDAVVFAGEPIEFGDGCLKARALSSRIGCAVLISLLREELPLDLTAVFTAQKEVGVRGALAAAFSVTPEIALILDAVSAADLPGVEEQKQGCVLGAGPVIQYMDQSAIADRPLFEMVRETASAGEIPWQMQSHVTGTNDASAYQRAKTGVRTLTIGVPVRYLRTPASVAKVSDMENLLRLVRAVTDTVADKVEG